MCLQFFSLVHSFSMHSSAVHRSNDAFRSMVVGGLVCICDCFAKRAKQNEQNKEKKMKKNWEKDVEKTKRIDTGGVLNQ